MAEHFDPYHEWLAIPPEDQPPHHYRLLGLPLFEAKPAVIEHAADRQMAHLRTLQTGKHSALSQKLLNQVSAARVCLLNPEKKAAYDAKLRKQLQAQKAEQPDESLDPGLMEALQAPEAHKGTSAAVAGSKPRQKLTVLIAVSAVIVAAVIGLIAWLSMSREKPQVAVGSAPPQVDQPVPSPAAPPAAIPPAKKAEPVAARPEPEKRPPKPVETSAASPPMAPAAPLPATRRVAETTRSPVAASGVKPAESAPAPAAKVSVEPPPTTPPSPKPEPAPPVAPKQKLPRPEGAALQQARKAAEALFKAEIANATTSAGKVALARRLLTQAVDQPVAADKYVLMVMAEELAVGARDADTAFQVVDQTAEAFEMDRFAVKTSILSGWAKDARTSDARRSLIEQILSVGDEAIDAGELEAAKELNKLAGSKAGGVREVAQKMKVYRQRLVEAGKDAEELKKAQEALSKNRKDPAANLALGRYLCFTKGDWLKGLPMLALGSDETLKALANQELTSPPSQPDQQVALADAWWEIASACNRSQANLVKIHAGRWYRQAEPGLPAGLGRNKVEQRLTEAGRLRGQLTSPAPALTPFDEKRAAQYQQQWADYQGVPVEITNSIGMKLVLIPPGEFDMGSTPQEIAAAVSGTQDSWFRKQIQSEAPRHHVRISRPFFLGRCEVTQGEYQQVMGVNPSSFSAKGKNSARVVGQDTTRHPVEMVSWDEAIEFCRRLSAAPGENAARRIYRLPTEAEWEYAARAGTTTVRYGGDSEDSLLATDWFATNSGGMPHPVGQKRTNGFGLYDMLGNVREWCADWFGPSYYQESPPVDPKGPAQGTMHVNRGGTWGGPGTPARCAMRISDPPGSRLSHMGFRLVLLQTH